MKNWILKTMQPSNNYLGYVSEDKKWEINICPIIGGGYRVGHNFSGTYDPQIFTINNSELSIQERKNILLEEIKKFEEPNK